MSTAPELKQLDDGIWVHDGETINFVSFPYEIRMTIVRLSDGTIWLHSPVQFTEERKAMVEALGPVKWIVTPNLFHNLFLNEWRAAFPDAKLLLPPQMAERRKHVKPDGILDGTPHEAWAKDIDQVLFTESFFMKEVVFFHRSSGSVILGDLIENHRPTIFGGIHHFIAKANAMYGKTPINYRWTFLKRDQARECFVKMMGWEPKRVIMMHGEIEEKDPIGFLQQAFAWLKAERLLAATNP